MSPDATTRTSAPPIAPASQLSPDFPWPGFAPYQEADRAYFHSRKLDTEELLRLVQRDVITLLIGPTGVGKTSLVHAGVIPALLEGESLPVVVRLDWFSLPPPPKPSADDDNGDLQTQPAHRPENPLTRQVITALEAAASAREVAGPTMRDGETLWEYFHRAGHRWWSNRQKVVTPVLIIDRFEEAFTVGRANATAKRHAEGFFEELSELAANRPPVRVGTHLENGDEPGDAFVFENVPVRVLLVMREEFTARLAGLRTTFPSLRRSQFRLGPFSTSQARDAIQRSAAQRNLFAEGAVDAVVEFLATEGPGEDSILPAHLSVVCSALSIERAHRGGAPITREFLSVRPGRLMHDFITAAVSDLPPAARALLEEHLTDLRGNSQRLPLADALARTGLPREALDTLVQRHLVRIDKLSAVPYVSLAHDLLASVLTITRLERITQAREQSAVLKQAQAHAEIQAQAATVEDEVRRQRTITWAIGTLAVLAAAAAIAAAIGMGRGRFGAFAASTPSPTPAPLSSPVSPTSVNPVTPLPESPTLPAKGAEPEPGAGGGSVPKTTPAPSTPEPGSLEARPPKGEPGPLPAQPDEPAGTAPHPPDAVVDVTPANSEPTVARSEPGPSARRENSHSDSAESGAPRRPAEVPRRVPPEPTRERLPPVRPPAPAPAAAPSSTSKPKPPQAPPATPRTGFLPGH